MKRIIVIAAITAALLYIISPAKDDAVFTFEVVEVGITTEELHGMTARSIRAAADELLADLRTLPSDYRTTLWLLESQLDKGDLTFADIGTEAEEIRELVVTSAKVAATEALEDLRNQNNIQYRTDLMILEDHLHEGDLTFADIGTDAEEIRELVAAGAKAASIMVLEWMKNEPADASLHIDLMILCNHLKNMDAEEAKDFGADLCRKQQLSEIKGVSI